MKSTIRYIRRQNDPTLSLLLTHWKSLQTPFLVCRETQMPLIPCLFVLQHRQIDPFWRHQSITIISKTCWVLNVLKTKSKTIRVITMRTRCWNCFHSTSKTRLIQIRPSFIKSAPNSLHEILPSHRRPHNKTVIISAVFTKRRAGPGVKGQSAQPWLPL